MRLYGNVCVLGESVRPLASLVWDQCQDVLLWLQICWRRAIIVGVYAAQVYAEVTACRDDINEDDESPWLR